MAAPADPARGERMLWAGLSAIVGMVTDGPGAAEAQAFSRIETACRSFGVSEADLDVLARMFGFYYYAPWDCYLDRSSFYEVGLREGYTGWMPAARGVH